MKKIKVPETVKTLYPRFYDFSDIAPTINEEFLIIYDHLPEYKIDYSLTLDQKRKKYFGQNMYLDSGINPHDTFFVYNDYLNIQHPGLKLFTGSGIPIYQQFEETTQTTNKKYKFICMMSRPRMHRILTSSWINENFSNDEYYYTANFNIKEDGITEHLQFVDSIHPGLPKHFIENRKNEEYKFANSLYTQDFYKLFYPITSSSVFNIITEPPFYDCGYQFTEKSYQPFMSYNIPIMHGYSACDSMKKIGFDMFDDIVNYSSQYITDPFDRTFRLLNDNKEILKNAFDILSPSIYERLEYNNQFMKSKDINKGLIYRLNEESTIETFKEIMYNTSNSEIKDCLKNAFGMS